MAEASWPSPNHNTRNVTDGEYEKLSARFSDDGVYGDPLATAVCTAGSGLQVSVRAGVEASVRGHYWASGTVALTLAVTANTSGSTRTDLVVLRLDRSTWDVTCVVKAGTPGAGAPALQQDTGDTGLFEIRLATVTVVNNATSVTVTRGEQYVGSRVRPCTVATRPPNPKRGEIVYQTDTSQWVGWTGSSWRVLLEDSGVVNLGAGFSTWTPRGVCIGQLQNGVVTLRLSYKRVTSQFGVTDSDGSMMGTVPVALRSLYFQYGTAHFSTGATCQVEVRTNGEIWALFPSENIPVGAYTQLTITYQI